MALWESATRPLGFCGTPIVLCAGVATALAVHHSGVGHAIACFSSNNLPLVAKYLSDRELDAVHGVVVAADNDIGLTHDSRIKNQVVSKAIEAARVCDGAVAFMGGSRPVGHDARDLYANRDPDAGPDAVRRYIATAQKPDLVQERFVRAVEAQRSGSRAFTSSPAAMARLTASKSPLLARLNQSFSSRVSSYFCMFVFAVFLQGDCTGLLRLEKIQP